MQLNGLLVCLAGTLGSCNVRLMRAQQNTRLPCGDSTKIFLPIGKNAVGDPVWSPPFPAKPPGSPVGRYDVKFAKVCGPGQFTFSPYSCERTPNKQSDEFAYKKTERTTECSVVDLHLSSEKVAGLGCMRIDCGGEY